MGTRNPLSGVCVQMALRRFDYPLLWISSELRVSRPELRGSANAGRSAVTDVKLGGLFAGFTPPILVSANVPSSVQRIRSSSQSGVFCLGLLEDRNVRVGVLPQREEALIRPLNVRRVVLQGIGT